MPQKTQLNAKKLFGFPFLCVCVCFFYLLDWRTEHFSIERTFFVTQQTGLNGSYRELPEKLQLPPTYPPLCQRTSIDLLSLLRFRVLVVIIHLFLTLGPFSTDTMASLLKDILLCHQQWEDEVEGKRSALQEPNSANVPIQGGTTLCQTRTVAAASASVAAKDTSASHGTELAVKETCYRSRPRGLPSSTVNVNLRHDNIPVTSCSSSTTFTSSAQNTVPKASSVNSSASATAAAATLALPFDPYPIQQEMCDTIQSVLTSHKPHVVPVAVAEVPTGCGKTMALLSSVLRYQQALKRMSAKEVDAYLDVRRPPWQRTPAAKSKQKAGNNKEPTKSSSDEDNNGDNDFESSVDARWTVPRSFFKHFRVDSRRKIRAELDVTGSQELRRRFLPPPCTIYYVTRTHAQLRQAVRELRRLHGAASAIRMNILGSRERYCIHPKVVQAKANRTLPVEGNNLGEVCDKLVSVGLCEMVDKYDELSCSAIGGAIGHQRGLIWDMEDLVVEGSARNMCPYYAARDLVFFADINFCTYPYLLDPLIRHETKMEAALKNSAVVVFDEAHNVSAVCQDALSLECPRSVLDLIVSELEPLVANRHTLARSAAATPATTRVATTTTAAGTTGADSGNGFATMQYPRELHLGPFTLVEIFSFLLTIFRSLGSFFEQAAVSSTAATTATSQHRRFSEKRPRDAGSDGCDNDKTYTQGVELEHHLRCTMETFTRTLHQNTGGGRAGARGETAALASLQLFRRAYGVIMSLGVTFNPFLFTVFGLSMLKRWLLLLRFLLQRPHSFVLTARDASSADDGGGEELHASVNGDATAATRGGKANRGVVEIRCLDGSLAFNHLLRSVHRVVLASGTLAPFTQLAQDLGLTPSQWRTVEGLHVVPVTQYRLTALTTLPSFTSSSFSSAPNMPLRCTYASLSSPSFLKAVARCVVQLAQTVQEQRGGGRGGGVLLFVPNYAVLHRLAKNTRELLLRPVESQRAGSASDASSIPLYLEPPKAEALTQVLRSFQCHTQSPRGGTALFFAVYRGKVSEGVDFTDDMARLVMCLGVPMQPLKSWKVVAQRAYSGPEWYTTDAVRAVNQALGRCLRHVRDYGAVILLDERYAQADYQQRLSRWCRAALQTDASLSHLCEALQASFAQWRRELAPPAASSSLCAAAVEDGGGAAGASANGACFATLKRGFEVDSQAQESDSARGRLGTDQLPFRFVRRVPARHRHTSAEELASPVLGDVQPGGKVSRCGAPERAAEGEGTVAASARESLLQSPFACTAVKLLYEAAHSTGDVSRDDLHAAIALLTKTFKEEEDDDEASNQDWH